MHVCENDISDSSILLYTSARIGAFLQIGEGGAEQAANENERLMYQGLTWKVSQD